MDTATAHALSPSAVSHQKRERLSIAVYTVGGSLIAIFQRFLTFSYDSFTINACRLSAGAAALLLIAFVFRRAELRATIRNPAQMRNIAVLALLGFIPQLLVVEGLARTPAVIASLLGLIGLPLSIGLAVLIFPDERQAVKGPRFAVGACLAIGSTLGLALAQGGASIDYTLGVIFAILATIIGVLTGLLTKRLVITANPICVSGLSTGLSALLFLAAALVWGDLGTVFSAPAVNNLILFGSGVYGLLIGGGLYMVIIKRSGLVVARFADLATPVFTGLFGLVLFGETLSPVQLALGAVLLVGCALILLRPGQAQPAPASKATCAT